MEDYYPSEIARLVLGYLDEVRCTKTWHTFLEESGDLHEHSYLLKHGKKCTTNVKGESLMDILKAYCALKSFFEQIICQYSWKEALQDIIYLQEQYNVHKQKTCYSTQKTGQSIVNSLREWISKISTANSSISNTDHVCDPHLLISLKNNEENILRHDKNCQKTTDKNIQTDLSLSDCLLKPEGKSTTQFVAIPEKRNECTENYIIDSTSDQEGIKNKLSGLNSVQHSVTQISNCSKDGDFGDKHFSPESSSFGQPLSLLSPENNERRELGKELTSQGKNLQVKRNLFNDASVSKNLSEIHLKSATAENVTLKKATEHLVELPKTVESTVDKCDCSDSNISSNVNSNSKECTDAQNQISNLAEPNKNVDKSTERGLHNLSVKETDKQISQVNKIDNSATNTFAFQEVASNNNSSFINSEHDLEIVENELECHEFDNEVTVKDILTVVSDEMSGLRPNNSMPLEPSFAKKESVSNENDKTPQTEEGSFRNSTTQVAAELSSMEISAPVENSDVLSTNTETIEKIETANDNPNFETFSKEMIYQNTIDQSESEKVDNCEANGNKSIDECHESLKSSENLTDILPSNQSSTVSCTTVPEFAIPNISSDSSGQNNIQYQIVLNTPISWNVPIGNGLSFIPPQGLSFVSPLSLSNVSNKTIFPSSSSTVVPNVPKHINFASSSSAAVPHSPLKNTAKQVTAATSVPHVANFETVITHNHSGNTKSNRTGKTQVDSEKSKSSKPENAPKTKQNARKRLNDEEKSKPNAGKRAYSKRLPKRKPLSLFESSPKSQEKIPVLSLSESPISSSKSSALKVVSKITDEFEEQCKSPVLKLLMTKAKEILKTDHKPGPSHVRCLNFDTKSARNDASNEIMIIDENDGLQENNNNYSCAENVVETLDRKRIQNNKLSKRDNVHDGNNKKKSIVKKNDSACSDKKIKSQKQSKRERKTDKKGKTPQKSKKVKVQNDKPLKKTSRAKKKIKLFENDIDSPQGKKKASLKKNKKKCHELPVPDRNNDLTINKENSSVPKKSGGKHEHDDKTRKNDVISVSPKKSFTIITCEFKNRDATINKENKMSHTKSDQISNLKDGAESNDLISASPKRSFIVKNYENLNKIRRNNGEKEDAVKELHNKKGSESQNENAMHKICVTTPAQESKSSSKNNEVQNKRCALNEYDESSRKSLKIINKTSVAPTKEFPVTERKEYEKESQDCSKNEVKLDHNLSKTIQSTVSKSSEKGKVAVIDRNYLSPKISKSNKNCKKNIELPRKPDKLENKKADFKENDNSISKKNMSVVNDECQSMNEDVEIISLDESNESFKISSEAVNSIILSNSQDNKIDASLDLNRVLLEDKTNQITVCDKNVEKLKNKNKACIAENSYKHISLKKDDEIMFRNKSNTEELSDINENKFLEKSENDGKKHSDEKKNNKVQNIRKQQARNKEIPMIDMPCKSQNKNSFSEESFESNKLPEKNKTLNCHIEDKSEKRLEEVDNVEKSEYFSKIVVFSNRSELDTALNNKENWDKEIELSKCDNTKLKEKIVFNDKNFELNEIKKNEQLHLNESLLQENTNEIKTRIEKENSEINTLQESVGHLMDSQKTIEDSVNSTFEANCGSSTNLQLQKSKKSFENTSSCTTILNKRKMTHPKKRIIQNLDACEQQASKKKAVPNNVEKVKQLPLITSTTIPVSNSSNLSIDKVSENEEISLMENDDKIYENNDDAGLNITNSAKPFITTSKILKEAAVASDFNICDTDNSFNKVSSSEENVKGKLTTFVLQSPSSKQTESITSLGKTKEPFISDNVCNLNTHINSDTVIKQQDSCTLDINENNALVAENTYLLNKEKEKNQVENNTLIPSSSNISHEKTKNSPSYSKYMHNISTNENDKKQNACSVIHSGNLDSVNNIHLSPNLSSKQTDIDLVNHSSNDTFHSISSDNDEDTSSNMIFHINNNTKEKNLEISDNHINIIKGTFTDGNSTSSANVRKRKLNDKNSDSGEMLEMYESTSSDLPLSTKKRIFHVLPSSLDRTGLNPPESKSKKQDEISYSSKDHTESESSQKLEETVHDKQNLSVKFKSVQDSPIRCLKKVKKMHPKTALSKKIQEDPRIPAGVKLPHKWNNSKIITYSNEIYKSTKNSKKNINKNVPLDMIEKEECLDVKSVDNKINNNNKQNLIEKSTEDCKLDKEPCVVLTRLDSNNIVNMQLGQNSSAKEKKSDQNILLDGDSEKIAEIIPENKSEIRTTDNPENILPQMQHFENTQDMVEADIGRSNDEGSELAIAIKNCEKELLSPQSVCPSLSPEKLSPDQSEKNATHLENNSVNQSERPASNKETKLGIIRNLVEKYGAEWLLTKLDNL